MERGTRDCTRGLTYLVSAGKLGKEAKVVLVLVAVERLLRARGASRALALVRVGVARSLALALSGHGVPQLVGSGGAGRAAEEAVVSAPGATVTGEEALDVAPEGITERIALPGLDSDGKCRGLRSQESEDETASGGKHGELRQLLILQRFVEIC